MKTGNNKLNGGRGLNSPATAIRIADSFSQIFLLCLLFSYVQEMAVFAAEPLLDPFAKTQPQLAAPDPFQVPVSEHALTLNLSPAESIKLPDVGYARSLAQRAVSGIEETAEHLRQNAAMISSLNETLKRYTDKIESLKQQKSAALDDMRRGAFCRTCRNTRSQLHLSAKEWQEHLDFNSRGVAVRATQQELDDKAKEFDGNIGLAEAEKAKHEPTILQAILQKIRESESAAPKIEQGMNMWRMAVTLEKTLINARDIAADQADERTIKRATEALNEIKLQIEQKPELSNPAVREMAEQQKAVWQSMIISRQAEGVARQRDRLAKLEQAKANEEDDFRRIILARHSVDSPPLISPTVSTILERLPLSYGPVSVKLHAGETVWNPVGIDKVEVVLDGKIMPAAAALKMDMSDPMATEVLACAKLLGRLEVCVGNQNEFGPNGAVTTKTVLHFDAKTPTPKINPVVLNADPLNNFPK